MDRDNRAAVLACCSASRCCCCCCCWQHAGMVMMSLVGCAYAKRACWALSCCCCSLLLLPQPHTHTLVCVWRWRRRRWRWWDRLRWGVVWWGSSVCGCVRVHR